MRHVGEDVARHDAGVADAKCTGGLHIFQFAQLQRFAAQQPAQAGPAGQAQHGAQQEKFQVGTLGTGFEEVGVFVEEDLHHQHASGDQQHIGH